MTRFIPKHASGIDVLILGEHPCACLVGALLKQKTNLRVVHVITPADEPEDRLVTLNPALFALHPLLKELQTTLPTTPIHGLQFLSDDQNISSEHISKPAISLIARYTDVRQQIAKLTEPEGVERIDAPAVQIHRVDEHGLEMTVGKYDIKPRMLILSSPASAEHKKLLGISETWGPDVVHRFTSVKCKSTKYFNRSDKKLAPMSLDLCSSLCWGWLLPGDGEFQLLVEQPIETATAASGVKLLEHWAQVLQRHGVLGPKFDLPLGSVRTMDRPLAGALAQEGVANRTLLIGPAGGFYSACGEDIYPACWSALFAADVVKKALKEPHLQDALNPYRQKWRTTLGDYLRGPQQNLRFLLPLVYKNPAMTTRIAEAILLSKSVVR